MLKFYVKASDLLTRLRTDKDGVVSFEYIIVAACIIGAVAAAFGTGGGGAIGTALTDGITEIVAAFAWPPDTAVWAQEGRGLCPTFSYQMMVAKSATFHLEEGIRLMLKHYIKASDLLERLRTDKDGVVSFEYIIVAACIIVAVAAAFGTGAGGAVGTALTNGITAISAAFAWPPDTAVWTQEGGAGLCLPPCFFTKGRLRYPQPSS